MVFGQDALRGVGTLLVCIVVVFCGLIFDAEGGSTTPTEQVIGYLLGRSILSCTHSIPRDRVTEVTWYKLVNGELTPAAKLVAQEDSGFIQIVQLAELTNRVRVTYNSLEITSVNLSDGGQYSCITSDNGRPQDIWWKSNLIVYVRPKNIVLLPRLEHALKEDTYVNITCSVQQVKPRPKIFWRVGDTQLMQNGSRADNLTEHQNGTFSVQSWYKLELKRQNNGKFLKCVVVQDGNREKVLGIEKTRITVHYKPYGEAEISPLTLEMAEGATETLHCTPPGVVGNPPASWFVWTMQNGTFLKNTTSPQLTLRPEYVNESRLYWCAVGNYLGQSGPSEWANVTVLDASIIRSRNGPLVRGSGIVPLVVGVVLGVVLVICIIAVSLVVWRHRRKSDGAYRSGGTKSAMLGMESMPLQCRSNAGDAIRNHPDASPPKKPPRIYSYEQGGLYKKYFKGLPTPPPTPPALDDCDDNKNVFATTQEEDKQVPKVEIVYAELKHASQRDFASPQPRVIYADLKFDDRLATGN